MRDRTKLHPQLQKKLSMLIIKCNQQGLNIGIGECVRTVEEQNKIYAQGRTTPGDIVTHAKGYSYSSHHQWGTAFDFFRNDGKKIYDDTDGFFKKVGAIGISCGLMWGNSWGDKPHFQLSDWGGKATALKQKYGTPEKFMKTWENVIDSAPKEDFINVSKQVIEVVQKWSIDYSGHNVEIDHVYGNDTRENIIRCIQKSLGLKQTGIEDSALYVSFKTVSDKQGDVNSGEVVKCIEALLFVSGFNPQDFQGNCTSSVSHAIYLYQEANELTADERCGDNTLRHMLK